ncbi:MAG: hypothetical protein JNG88_06160 [Phycisphaerales bacterium]|nr:hypothetical protein [Phycisphaerales bacterium]
MTRAVIRDVLCAGKVQRRHSATFFCPTLPVGVAVIVWLTGCASLGRPAESTLTLSRSLTIVVAPVVNLSDTREIDVMRLTDWVASEAAAFDRISVVPVNLTLAVLARSGKSRIETGEDALWLARQFQADATVVAAVTEYAPYDPPRMTWVMQWYENAADSPASESPARPAFQVQRVFYAAADEIEDEVKEYADQRDEHDSAYGWRRYIKSQEAYARYCCWAMIRTIIRLVDHQNPIAQAGGEWQTDHSGH